MGSPRRYSRKANELASVWIARKEEFCRLWEEDEADRQKYRDALALKLPPLAGGLGFPGGQKQVDIHLAFRIYAYYASQAYDEFPDIRMPRDGSGDAAYGPMVEKWLTKDMARADAVGVSRAVLADILTDGCGVISYGLPRFPTPTEVAMVNLDPATAIQTVLEQGGYEVVPGMDHNLLATALLATANDPQRMVGADTWVRGALTNQAMAHQVMAEREDRRPMDWRLERGAWWCDRRIPGTSVFWDTQVSDVRHCRWWMERLLYAKPEVDKCEGFSREGRRALQPKPIEHVDPGVESHEENFPGREVFEHAGMIEILRVYDRMYETCHYIVPGGEGSDAFYLEEDEAYPFLDMETLEPAIGDFFPFVHIAPYQSNERSAKRTFGLPLLKVAWPIIEQIIQLEGEVSSQVKRNVRTFGFHPEVWGNLGARRAITSGIDGEGFEVPITVWNGGVGETGVRPVVMPSIPADLAVERERLWNVLTNLTGIPATALLGQATAPTKGQQEMVEAGQGAQTGDLVGQLARGFAKLAEGCRAIGRLSKTKEDIRFMLGDKCAELWDGWAASEQKTDKLQVIFSGREMDVRKIEQLMKAFDMAVSAPQLMIDPMPLLEELWREFKLGEVQFRAPTPQEKLAMAKEAMGLRAGANGQEQPGRGRPGAEAPRPARGAQQTSVPEPVAMSGAIGRSPPAV